MRDEDADKLSDWAFNATDAALKKALVEETRRDRFAVLHAEWRVRGYEKLPWPKYHDDGHGAGGYD